MLGNLDIYYKGHDIAIKALAYIKNDIPDFMLYIAGNGKIYLLTMLLHVEFTGAETKNKELSQ